MPDVTLVHLIKKITMLVVQLFIFFKKSLEKVQFCAAPKDSDDDAQRNRYRLD